MGDYLTLTENRDFKRLYSRGKSYVSPVLVTYVMRNRAKTVRTGITTSRKTGNAVCRNRARRVIRESFRQLAPLVQDGYDFVFVSRARTAYVKSTEVYSAMEEHFKKAGVFK